MTDFRTRRERLVDRLESRGRVERRATLDALRAVPRHAFVPEGQSRAAYEDRPLPIGEGQTISAPHMVGIMTDLLAPRPGDRILEIGTGCGYHADHPLLDSSSAYSRAMSLANAMSPS